jgi:hypothetical protein
MVIRSVREVEVRGVALQDLMFIVYQYAFSLPPAFDSEHVCYTQISTESL